MVVFLSTCPCDELANDPVYRLQQPLRDPAVQWNMIVEKMDGWVFLPLSSPNAPSNKVDANPSSQERAVIHFCSSTELRKSQFDPLELSRGVLIIKDLK